MAPRLSRIHNRPWYAPPFQDRSEIGPGVRSATRNASEPGRFAAVVLPSRPQADRRAIAPRINQRTPARLTSIPDLVQALDRGLARDRRPSRRQRRWTLAPDR